MIRDVRDVAVEREDSSSIIRISGDGGVGASSAMGVGGDIDLMVCRWSRIVLQKNIFSGAGTVEQ